MFGRFEPTIANIYIGLAERARDLTIERIRKKTSVAEMTRSMAYHPGVQQAIANIVIELEGMIAHADRIAEDWTNGVDHGGMWPAKRRRHVPSFFLPRQPPFPARGRHPIASCMANGLPTKSTSRRVRGLQGRRSGTARTG